MKNSKSALIFFVFCGLTMTAQTSKNSKEKMADTKNVALAVDELYVAMVNRDQSMLENLTMDEMTYGHSSGTIENKTEFLKEVVEGTFDYISIEPTEQTIHLSEEMAIVRHIFNVKAVNEGTAVTIQIGNMMVFKKSKGQWKLLARQAYKL